MYDAIVVGARCAGSPTAMLLARKGCRVLLVDKASFPSDTISTHIIWPHGAELLERWGLLERVAETGCTPIALDMTFDVGPVVLRGGVKVTNQGRGGFCPRRTVLDKLLVDAAVESGAELRENFTVEELTWDGDRVAGIKGHGRDGNTVEERARIVIGADGVHSFVAKAVKAPEHTTKPPLNTLFYSYFSGVPDANDVEQYVRPFEGAAYFPTNDGLTLIGAVWPADRFQEIRSDPEEHVVGVHRRAGQGDRLDSATREDKWYGTAGVPNFFRKPYGPGWALVGDAGYERDYITAQGISDGFIDAQNLTDAIEAGFTGRQAFNEALAGYEKARDERVTPHYHLTTELATLEPPPPMMQQLFGAMADNRDATEQFFAALTGSTPVPEFMNPENIGGIMAAAGARA